MGLQASFTKKVFKFNFKARTSRGLMKDKTSWFINVWDSANPGMVGIGECGPLPGLSIDAGPNFEESIAQVVNDFNLQGYLFNEKLLQVPFVPVDFPSIIFGFESALLDLMNGGKRILFNNNFIQHKPLPINGLVWMGDMEFMMGQLSKKISEGFSCLKLKVGGLNFDLECDILSYIRKRFFREDLTIRLDANGAFNPGDALSRLNQLSKYTIHSIEQPIKQGLPEMEAICKESPIAIAFDEELIGKHNASQKRHLLETVKPSFIVLKPTLHGGLKGCAEWIARAEELGMGWWITSALESNIGLNAICQFTANYPVTIPQGLGTGAIYENNIASPLKVENGTIFLDASLAWATDLF